MNNHNIVWGIDLGGTKIEGAVVDIRSGIKIIERLRVPTEAHLGYDHILDQIQLCISKISEKTGLKPEKIGIGTPGIVDKTTKLIKNSNTISLIGKPMQMDLELRFGIPVKMANDANCFAIAEAQYGIVPDHVQNPEVVWGIIMGTGVGSGVVVNSKVIHGHHGIGGEWGHFVLEENGPGCYCGKKGCVETFISGPALQKYYQKLSNESLGPKEIYQRFEAGEANATQAIDHLIHYFGKAVGIVINIIDPDVVVIGGGLGNLDVLYSRGVEEVKQYIFNNTLNCLFLKPKLGDSAGVIGAALL